MKKILAMILAGAAVLTMSATVFAEAEKTDEIDTTITFDTDKALEYVHPFGSANEAGLTMTISEDDALSGKALHISESFTETLSSRYGGFCLDASDFGLDSFAGHTIKININADENAAKKAERFELFSDGVEWQSKYVSTENAGIWISASLTVPADMANTKLGVCIPITEPFEGSVGIFDDIVITDNYGKTIANIGDIDTSLYEAPNSVLSVLTTILFILLIIAVVLGAGYFLRKVLGAYR